MKTVDFSESIADCDQKLVDADELIEFMKECEYSRPRLFRPWPKVIFIRKLKLAFL